MRRNEGNFQIVNDDSSEASAMLLRTLSGENGKTGGPLSEISQEHEIRVTDRRNRGASARLDSTRLESHGKSKRRIIRVSTQLVEENTARGRTKLAGAPLISSDGVEAMACRQAIARLRNQDPK